MANSPSTFAPDNVDRYLPSRDTSTRPSAKKEKERKKHRKELTIKIDKLKRCLKRVNAQEEENERNR